MEGIIRSTTYPRKLKVEELDFFSEGVSLTVGQEDRVKTKCGAVLTISLYTLLILSSIYYLQRFIATDDPNIQYNVVIDSNSNIINMEKSDLYFVLLIQNPYSITKVNYNDDYYDDGSDYYDENGDYYDDSEDFYDPDSDPDYDPNARRILQSSTTSINYFLSFEDLKYYFNTTVQYQAKEYKVNTTGEIFTTLTVANKTLVKCNETDWYSKDNIREAILENKFSKSTIERFGLCLKINSGTTIFGDKLTQKSALVNFVLSVCDDTSADTEAAAFCVGTTNILDQLRKTGGIDITVGAIEPAINNSLKTDMFTWSLNIDNSFKVDGILNTIAEVRIKKIQAVTDHGWLIENKKTESKAAIFNMRSEFSTKFSYGDASPTPDQYYMLPYDDLTIFTLNFVASRTTEEFTRSYDTILDLFGNIGGSIDFLALVLVILFHWHENYTTSTVMRKKLSENLKLPSDLSQRETSVFGLCCKKTRQSTKDALDELVDDALSFENLALLNISNSVLQETMFKPEILTISPIIAFMKKAIKAKKEEDEKEKNSLRSKEDKKAAKDQEEEEKVDLKVAYQNFMNLELDHNEFNGKIKQSFIKTIAEYQKIFSIENAESCFEQDQSQKPNQSNIKKQELEEKPDGPIQDRFNPENEALFEQKQFESEAGGNHQTFAAQEIKLNVN